MKMNDITFDTMFAAEIETIFKFWYIAVPNLIKMIKLYKPAEWEAKSYATYDLYGIEPMINGSNNTRR